MHPKNDSAKASLINSSETSEVTVYLSTTDYSENIYLHCIITD